MPLLTAQIIQRQRVTKALEEALASHALVVLTAQMGHGKTTAAEQLLWRWKSRSLYLRMKPGWQENANYLWHELCTKLEQQGMSQAGALKLIGVPDDDARLYRCLAVLREYLSNEPTLLVLDDYHFVDSPALTRLFENLVSEEVPGFKLLILSRSKPDMQLAYLRAKGYAAVLDATLLDFTSDEARSLFEAAGEPDHEPADMAQDYSKGWAAALRICLQSYMTDRVIRPVRSIEQLLSETFFATYSVEDQCLLLQLSVLDSFNADQAVFLTSQAEASHRLRKLYEQNAFIQYSPGSDKYSIHALLRSFLQQSLKENSIRACSSLDVHLLYRRAAESSMKSENYLQAMRLYAQAGGDEDLLEILRIFESPDEGLFILPAPAAVLGIIKDIPWEVRFRSPIGYLGFIHRWMVRVSKPEAEQMAREARERFLAEGALPEETQRKIRGELALIGAVQSFNDFAAMGRCYEQAVEFLEGRSSLVNQDMFWSFNCPHSAFLYLRRPGGYEELEKLAAEKLPLFQQVSGGANAGAVELLMAERLLETGRPQTAQPLLQTAKYKTLESQQYAGILAAFFTLARHQLAEDDADGVYELFEPLRKPVEKRAHPALLHNLEVCQGYIASVRNDLERIPSWLLQHEPLAISNNQAHSFSQIVRGKAIMALKNWPRLQAFAEEIEPQIAGLDSLFGRLHILIFKAVAAANLQQHSTALSDKYLLQALELARPDGIITSLAEYGGHLYPLLQRLENSHPERRDLGQLIRASKRYARLGKKQGALKFTLRETDILEMARAGANNKEIGARLGITQGSVANHMSRIYLKLGVGSRIEAINKWAEETALLAEDKSPA